MQKLQKAFYIAVLGMLVLAALTVMGVGAWKAFDLLDSAKYADAFVVAVVAGWVVHYAVEQIIWVGDLMQKASFTQSEVPADAPQD